MKEIQATLKKVTRGNREGKRERERERESHHLLAALP